MVTYDNFNITLFYLFTICNISIVGLVGPKIFGPCTSLLHCSAKQSKIYQFKRYKHSPLRYHFYQKLDDKYHRHNARKDSNNYARGVICSTLYSSITPAILVYYYNFILWKIERILHNETSKLELHSNWVFTFPGQTKTLQMPLASCSVLFTKLFKLLSNLRLYPGLLGNIFC